MKTHVVKTTPDAYLSEAVDLMDIYQVDSLSVVDEQGCLCGMIAEQDIAGLVLNATVGPSHNSYRDDGSIDSAAVASNRRVGEIMQRVVVSISEDMSITKFARSLFVNDYSRIPVTSIDGAVVGTLNRIDIIQCLFEGRIEGIDR